MSKELITIDSGTIELKIDHLHEKYKSIHDLISFASRRNSKRGFLFVSKILGKHIPVKPSLMRESYNDLAELIGPVKESTFVVGMSETATGMGAGVADSMSVLEGSGDVYFQHTTRHHLDKALWFNIQESHSHAVSHIVYQPEKHILKGVKESNRIILVDDEISTGNTLLQLSKGYLDKMHEVKEIHIVALVSWLSKEREMWFQNEINQYCEEMGYLIPDVVFHALAKGSFEFKKNPEFNEELPKTVDKGLATEFSSSCFGRLGLKMPLKITSKAKKEEEPISIIGTGEHLYHPFLIAEELELNGADVLFQSTTRSPVFEDGEIIKNTMTFDVEREGDHKVHHFIYNLDKIRTNRLITESDKAKEWYGKVDGNKAFENKEL